MQKIYIETSIISYLTARRSRDIITLAQQEITREWWQIHRFNFSLFISELVIEEAKRGDKEAAQKRLDATVDLSILEAQSAALELTMMFLQLGDIPKKASADALHIAIATVHKMDFLLTWNCTHIANAQIQKSLRNIAQQKNYDLPIICTPNELVGGKSDVER